MKLLSTLSLRVFCCRNARISKSSANCFEFGLESISSSSDIPAIDSLIKALHNSHGFCTVLLREKTHNVIFQTFLNNLIASELAIWFIDIGPAGTVCIWEFLGRSIMASAPKQPYFFVFLWFLHTPTVSAAVFSIFLKTNSNEIHARDNLIGITWILNIKIFPSLQLVFMHVSSFMRIWISCA